MGPLARTLGADLRHMTGDWDARPAGVAVAAVPRVLLQPRFRAVVYFRFSQWAWRRPHGRALAYWFQSRAIRSSGAEIHPAAAIGPGLNVVHSVGIVVGHEVVAGADLVLIRGSLSVIGA